SGTKSKVHAQRLRGLFQEFQRGIACLVDLLERALRGCFVGAPADEFRAVAEASGRHVIVGDFNDKLRGESLPLTGAFRGPATRAAWSASGKPWRLSEQLQLPGQRLLFRGPDRRTVTDMVEKAGFIVKAKQQRADE